jgi:hypothetical protein
MATPAEQLGIKLLVPDRPGFGRSTPGPNGSFAAVSSTRRRDIRNSHRLPRRATPRPAARIMNPIATSDGLRRT